MHFSIETGINDDQKQAAEQLGISVSMLSKWKKNQYLWFSLEQLKSSAVKKLHQLQPTHAWFPEACDELYMRFLFKRNVDGFAADGYWLRSEMTKIVEEMKPAGWDKFVCSRGWLFNWVNRYNLSSQAKTDKKSNSTLARLPLLMEFFDKIRFAQRMGPRVCDHGFFHPCCIWNVDQIPMPFSLNPKRSYNTKGQPCWIAKVGKSGLDKRQCSVQLTLRAEGEQFVHPVIVFKGCICPSRAERAELDKLKNIQWGFQPKAWADRHFLTWWLASFVKHLKAHGQDGKFHLLVLDNLSGQRMESFQEEAMRNRIFPLFTSPDCTDVLQPVDHHVGAWLKYCMGRFYAVELGLSLNEWRGHGTNKSLSSARRRVLMATWLDHSWAILKTKSKFIRAAFESTGCLIKLDGSHQIKIRQLDDLLFPFFPPFEVIVTDSSASCCPFSVCHSI
jgi:hypothetical protein